MMKKAIGLDHEHQAAGTLLPLCRRDRTAVVVMTWCSSGDRKCSKAVLALNLGRGAIEQPAIDLTNEGELVSDAKRRPRVFVRADVIAVAASDGTVPGVKFEAHLDGALDPDVLWQKRVERAAELLYVPAIGHSYPDGLSTRMHSGVGSP